MFDENKEKQFILQLFNLECSDVQDVSCIRAGNTVIIDITLASDPVPCPVCGKTYYEHNPFVFKSMKISALTVYNILNDLKITTRHSLPLRKDTTSLLLQSPPSLILMWI